MSSVIKLVVLVMYITATATAVSYLDDFLPDGYRDKILDAAPLKRHKRANMFSGQDPEGEEVLNRLNSIMSNSSISERSKQLLEAAIGNIGNSGARSSPDKPAETNRPSGGGGGGGRHKLMTSFPSGSFREFSFNFNPPDRKTSETHERSQTLHATECCCKVDMPPLTERKQYPVTRYRYMYKAVRTYRSCGFWRWARCAYYISVLESRPYTIYTTQYYLHYIEQSCPTRKEVCCRGFVAYKRCCTNIRELKRLLDLFISQRDKFESLHTFLRSQGYDPGKGCPLSCGP